MEQTQAIETPTQETNNNNGSEGQEQPKQRVLPSWAKDVKPSKPATKTPEPKKGSDSAKISLDGVEKGQTEKPIAKEEKIPDQTAKSETKPPEPGKQTSTFKFKVDGKEWEENLTQDQIHQRLQRAQGAEKRMQDAVNLIRQNQQLIGLINNFQQTKDLKTLLSSLGIQDDRKMLEDYYYENYLKLEQMTEAERNAELAKRENETLKKQLQEHEQQKKNQELESATQVEKQRYHTEIVQAMKNHLNDIPQNEWAISQIAYYLREALRMGLNKTAEEVIPLVKDDYDKMMSRFLKGSPIEEIISKLGDDGKERFRKFLVDEIKKAPAPVHQTREPQYSEQSTTKEKKYMSMDEFKERNRKFLQSRGVDTSTF